MLLGRVARILSITLSLFCLLHISGGFRYLGIEILLMQYRGACLVLALALVFLLYPFKGKKRQRLPWYDIALLAVGVAGGLYFVFFINLVIAHSTTGITTTFEQVLGFATVIVVIEAVRRLVGWPMALIVGLAAVYPLLAEYSPGLLYGRSLSTNRTVYAIYLSAQGLLGIPMEVATTIIIVFIIFGSFLIVTGAGKFFTDIAFGLLGGYRGGPAKGAVFGSALMGTVSGSSTANAATIGAITIPMMKSVGYSATFAGAVEAVSGNGGALMPPVMGAVAFLIPEFIPGVSYLQVCIASAIPALLYYFALFVMVDFEAARTGLKGLPRASLPSVKKAFLDGWLNLVPVAVLLFLLAWLKYSPEKSAAWSLASLVVVSSFKKESRLNLRKIMTGLEEGAKSTLMVMVACAGAGIIIGSIMVTGVGVRMSSGLVEMSGGNLLFLAALTAVVCFILGMGTSAVTVYIMLVALVAPGLIQLGVVPLAAHLFILWWGLTSYITPPVAPTAFVAAGIAGSPPNATGWQAVKLGIGTLVLPFVFLTDTSLLLMGPLDRILFSILTTTSGLYAISAAFIGYMFKPLSWWERTIFAASAVALFIPGSRYVTIGGGAVFVAIMLWHWIRSRVLSSRELAATDMKNKS